MSNRDIVIDLLARLPEDAPLEYIAREIEFLAGIRTARDQVQRRRASPPTRLESSWTHGLASNPH
jgi:hypothetical protein